MSSYAESLLQKFRTRGLLIDTNLLLLYLVGEFDEKIVRRGSFDRLSAYSLEDLQLLRNLMSLFETFITTPHILTEVSNWVGYLPHEQEIACLRRFHSIFVPFTELNVPSAQLDTHEKFPLLGLTDTAIAHVADSYLILSDDARMIGQLNQLHLEALNINHLRQELWLQG